MPAAFSCFVIGDGALAAECASILSDAGQEVCGIMSANAQVARWADERAIPLVTPADDVASAVRQVLAARGMDGVDWLFSVVNTQILGPDVLALARRGVINYHDAPLPRYAGMHATSWAIINGERRHAIAWHLASERVDAGDIVKQVPVEIEPDDTAFSLNAKCYVAAIESFRDLVGELAAGAVRPVPQDLSQRTFFGRHRRPAAASVLRWDRTADELANLARGLEFGPVPNPLGRARLLLQDGTVLLAPRLTPLAGAASAAPGTIVGVDADGIVVCAADRPVAIRELRTLDGAPVAPADAARTYALHVGDRLPILDAQTAERLQAYDAAARRGEEAWVPRLATLAPFVLPYLKVAPARGQAERIVGAVPESVRSALAAVDPARAPGELLAAACALYWWRVSDREGVDVGILAPWAEGAEVERRLFAESVPVSTAMDPSACFADAAGAFVARLTEAEARGPLLRDVVTRYPSLDAPAGHANALQLPVTLAITDAPAAGALPVGSDLAVRVSRDATSWDWCYDAGRLAADDVARMMAHVETLVTAAATEPTCAVAELPLLPERERRLVMEEWNAATTPVSGVPEGATLASLFAAQAARTPHAVAVVDGVRELTYAELDARAGRLARRLRALGVGPEARVGVCLSRTAELVVALLGVLEAGGAYVPLDPAYPAERVAFMLEDSGAAVVVTEAACAGLVAGAGRRLVLVDRPEDDAEDRAEDRAAEAGPSNLAYLIYTSGSTGRPKGVAIEHRSAVARVTWARAAYSAAELAGVLAATSVCFDLSVFELFAPLTSGGSVILAESALALPGLAARDRVTLVNTVPSAAAELLRAGGLPAAARTVNLAGEPLPTALVDRLYAAGVERVYDLYGPSEDTTYSTQALRRPGAPPTIGRPLAGTRAYVLDAARRPLPAGVPGELYLGGAGLARGYHARAELTAERFVPDPFAEAPDAPNARLYRTGDRVRWRADGTLEFLGRLDFQVKIRGFRVEPGEVEARLLAHPRVRDVVVVVRDDGGERRLVAYLVADGGAPVPTGELRDHLLATLPDYMVPAVFVWLPVLPLSSNGKVDRKALPVPQADRATLSRAYEAPRTPVEAALAETWAKVLRVERVGVEDNFFELGGDSILMIQIVSRARRLGLALSQREMFRHPTVAALAKVVQVVESTDDAAGDAAVSVGRLGATALGTLGVSPAAVEDAYPLSPMQQGLLFHGLADATDGAYLLQVVFDARGPLDVPAFRGAWDALVRRHPVLRTAFAWEGVAEPLQVVLREVTTPWREEDWRADGAAERAAKRERLLAADRAEGFDLARAPLMRLTLIRTADDAYEVVWSVHHLLLDGWSTHALLAELHALYEARCAGVAPAFERPRPYRDYVAALRQGDAEAEAFWRARLAGFTAPTPLGIERRRDESAMAGAGAQSRETAALGADVTAALQTFARERQVTLNTIVQGAWAILLGRYASETDVLFGATVTTRPATLDGVDRMVGLFLNTVPVRAQVRPDAPLGAWLQALQREQAEVRAHETAPLGDIQKWSAVAPGTPLFDSLLVFENYPGANPFARPAAGVTFGAIDILERTHYPLTLVVIPGARLTVHAMYDATLLDRDAVLRMLAHLETLLRGMVSGADAPVASLEILPDAERRLLLEAWAGERVTYEGGATLAALLAVQAARTPNAIAVEDERTALTYAELHSAATALARRLRAAGVGAGVLVAVCAERSVELVVALVATVRAGGAYVPLDPEYPADRLAFMLADAAPRVLLATRETLAVLPPCDAHVIALEGAAEARDAGGEALPVPDASDPAYMIYTSGSTGRPKGALNAHRGVVNRLQWMQSEYRLTAADVVLQKTPFSFDVSVWELFWPLMTGAKLVMARPGGHRDPAYLGDVMRARGVTVCHFVPSMLRAFLAEPGVSTCRTLRAVMASGEALPPDLVAAFNGALPEARLHNLYGPTECAVDVSYWPCPPSTVPPAVVPIGRPVSNTRLHVLDEQRRPVPIGVPGELFIAGVQVGLGYHNRPELTAERFVPDPLAHGPNAPNARMYRTGDRARWLADGTVEYLGRLDFQVKIRGFRIELGEIESVLLAHPDVRDCVVVARDDRGGDKQLVAYYVAAEGATADAAGLRAHLAAALPSYMVPPALVRLDALPLSANGKVDRKALPAPAAVADAGSAEYAAPTSEAESTLARVWADALRVERVGVHDNYFELGGDSILSIQIAARAREAGLKVSVGMFAKHPTVASMAAAVERHAPATPADAGPSTGTAPLTPIQRWFFELDPAERNHWNQTFLFRTETALDERALRGAVAELLRHHDALRLRFSRVDGEWHQHFAPLGAGAPVWVEDLSGVADDVLPAAIAEVTERGARSLSITDGPSLRVVYVKLGGARGGRLLVAVHHLVVDGISWRILLEDLEAAYGRLVAGEAARLPAKTTSFQQWAADLSAHASSASLAAERPYWLAVSEGPLVRLPVDGRRDAPNTVGDASTVVATLDARETAELLQRVPAAYATQVNDVLLVALAEALGPWAGAGALLLDLEGHGREEIVSGLDLTRTVGWFTSVFPVRLPLGGGDVGARLKAMKEMLRAVPRRGVGYGSLRYLTADAELASRPAPELVFNYLGQFDQLVADSALLRFAQEDAGPWLSPKGRRRHVLEINALVLNGQLEFRWTFGRELHDEATVRRLADAMLASLRSVIAHCRAPSAGGRTPSDFPLVRLTQAQVDRLVGDGKRVEEVAPLAPMQALFLATSAGGGGADVGFEQWRFDIAGPLDVDAFRRAWQLMAARHEILRTAFHSTGLDAPVQVVLRQAELPFAVHDWRDLDEATRVRGMEALLAADRATGFRVDEAPLCRLTLVRTGDAAWTLVWSNHHLLLDRWSWPIVLREVGAAYQALRAGGRAELAPATPWRRYLAWLAERDAASAEAFWRAELAGIEATALSRLAGAGEGDGGERRLDLTAEETARLAALARARRVTVNTLLSAAWALWLARATGRADVVFGLAVSGRPEEVAGIERLVGMCINNVPSRVRVDPAEPLPALLGRIESSQAAAGPHGHAPLTDMQRWSELPWHHRLFDTLVVFQHHGADDETVDWLGASHPVRMDGGETRTNYPLALVVSGKEALVLRLAYHGRFAGAAGADRVLAELRALLSALVSLGRGPVGDAMAVVASPPAADGNGAPAERVVTPPRTDAEWVVAHIWAELLGRDEVGIDENFFDLGGQSLVATQIMSRVRDGFQMELPVSLLFEHPTVEAFAAAVRRRERAPGRVDRIAGIIRRVEEMTVQELREAGIHE